MKFILDACRGVAIVSLATAILAPFTPSAQAQSRRAECLLFVEGREIISGTCMFSPSGRDGSFEIMALNGSSFAQVHVDRPGVAQGYWNGGQYQGHAHDHLGTLTRNEACWSNETASVCAW